MSADATARDSAARVAAQCEFGRPLALEAGAGTGKTTALVARVTHWCLGPGWERATEALRGRTPDRAPPDADVAARAVSRVVAITFTEAAAAEMARRIGETLAAIAASGAAPERAVPFPADLGVPDPVAAMRARALLAVLDRLPVRTIHAHCQRVLARHPLEAGLHPSLVVDADGALREQAIRDAIEAWLQAPADAALEADRVALATARVAPAGLAEALDALVTDGCTPAELAEPVFTPEVVTGIGAGLEQAARRLLGVAGEALAGLRGSAKGPAVGTQLADAAVATVAALSPGLSLERWTEVKERVLACWTVSVVDRLDDYAAGTFNKTESNVLVDLGAPFQEAAAGLAAARRAFAEADPPRFETARRVLRPLLADVLARLRRRGVLGFDAILRETAGLLRESPAVARAERRAMDQLLVDEFQDTDRVQCEIVRALALSGPPEERPGLFLVGDPKQSIYGWRSADLRAYEAMLAEVKAAGGEVRELCVNFRSAPPILDEVERLLAPLLVRREGVQPPFQPLVASKKTRALRGYVAGTAHPVEHWFPCERDEDGAPKRTTSRRAAEIEARALAADLLERHAEGVAWRDVAILLRGLSDVDVVLEALRRHHVPFEVAKDRAYYRRREVIEAAALVRCVVDPHDQLALVTWLRSAAVGVPDAAWLPLFARDLPARVARLQRPDPPTLDGLRGLVEDAATGVARDVPGLERVAAWPAALVAALESLAVLRTSFRSEAPDVFVERLRTLGGLESIEAGRFLGRHRVANLERFYRELAQLLADGADPADLLRHLRRAVAEQHEVERGVAQSGADAVQVLSIHGAKGLQFPHVYVLQLHKGMGRAPRGPATERGQHDGVTVLRLLGAPGPGCAERERAAAEREDAELVRILYVATTRPEARLVLSGLPAALAHAAGGSASARFAARREEGDGAAAATSAQEAGGRHVDASGVLWRLPEWEAAALPRAAAAGPPPLPGAAAVRAEAEALAAARAAAARRARRSLSRPASAEAHETLQERFERAEPAREREDAEPERERSAETGHASRRGGDPRVVGSAVHRALETMRLDDPPDSAVAAAEGPVAAVARSMAAPVEAAAVEAEALRVLRRFVSGDLFARLRAIAARGDLVARELPLLAGPTEGDLAPVGFVAGTIDLLYRESGAWVVADFKTDDVAGDALRERAAQYAAQGAAYVRAVQEAFALPALPRFELWFLRAGEVVTVPPPA